MTAEPTAEELHRGLQGYLSAEIMFVCRPGYDEASFPILILGNKAAVLDLHHLDIMGTPDKGIIRGIELDFTEQMYGGMKLRLAMLMAGPELDVESRSWGRVAAWLRKKHVRVIGSKKRRHLQHPLIQELRGGGVSVTMVPFQPHLDGFFVFLGPVGPVSGEDRLETNYLPASAGRWGMRRVWSSLPAPAAPWYRFGESPDRSTTCNVVLCYPSSDSSDEDDNGRREAEANIRKKARRDVLSPGIVGPPAEFAGESDI